MAEDVELTRIDAGTALGRMAELVRVYGAAFAGPPFYADPRESEQRREAATEQLNHPGAEVVIAEHAGELLGAVWGWAPDSGLPNDELHRRIRAAADEQTVTDYLGAALAVVELMVDPAAQRQGIGARLLAEIVGGRPAWLVTHPDSAGMSLYRAAGWRAAAELTAPNGIPLVLLVRPGAR